MGELSVEEAIMKKVQEGCTYKEIMEGLKDSHGMISKRFISKTVKTQNPELWALIGSTQKAQLYRSSKQTSK